MTTMKMEMVKTLGSALMNQAVEMGKEFYAEKFGQVKIKKIF